MNVKGGIIRLPQLVTGISGFKNKDKATLVVEKGKIEIKKMKKEELD